jgi:hypothetical protein
MGQRMSGMINAPSDAPSDAGGQPSSGGGLSNPLLQQAEQQLESGLTAANKADYDKIVVAGLHIALDKGPDSFMAKLKNSRDPIGDSARGAASLVLIERKQSRGVMPMKAMVPAGMTLLFHALDFCDRAKIASVAEPQIDQATTTFVNFLFHKLGITPGMLQSAAGKVHAITQDPQSMAAISLKAGLTRHPMAATPTPLPGGMINGGTTGA